MLIDIHTGVVSLQAIRDYSCLVTSLCAGRIETAQRRRCLRVRAAAIDPRNKGICDDCPRGRRDVGALIRPGLWSWRWRVTPAGPRLLRAACRAARDSTIAGCADHSVSAQRDARH